VVPFAGVYSELGALFGGGAVVAAGCQDFVCEGGEAHASGFGLAGE